MAGTAKEARINSPIVHSRSLTELITPCFLIDRTKMRRNIARLARRMRQVGGVIRPHVKTHKSFDVLQEVMAGGQVQGITVSTLAEAEYFFSKGVTDILYAVGIAPNKLPVVRDLIRRGCDLKIVLDSVPIAECVAQFASAHEIKLKILLELDTDGHRAGIAPDSPTLLDLGHRLNSASDLEFLGVMTHAGGSYACDNPKSQLAMAIEERDLSVRAAQRLRAAGIACETISVGSTPTAFALDSLAGVTEVRAGVYVFFDLVMAGLGVCAIDDIAISVLASVIGHQRGRSQVIIDAGWMAMSRDRGTQAQGVDQGYGVVTDLGGNASEALIVGAANQEHGIVKSRDQSAMDFDHLPLGGMLRVLPNHACATAAQFDDYYVVDGESVTACWDSIRGW